MRYRNVCVAGTFDGLHAGHEAILRKAFAVGKRVLIGFTSDDFVRRYKSPRLPISSYDIRKQALSAWLMANGYHDRATIVAIDDPYEPAVSSQDVEALVVSEETKKRGEELNRKREENGLASLVLIVVPMQKAKDGTNITSTRIRKGEVDRVGRLLMPDTLRGELAQPLGRVLVTPEMMQESFEKHRQEKVITVGDLTTKTFLDSGITPKLMIIDNKVERKAYPDLQPIFAKRRFPKKTVASGPGFIARAAITMIKSLSSLRSGTPTVIDVTGEEDLLTLPAIAYAPLGSVVYYGQPAIPSWACGPVTQGIVEVVVTKEKQEEASDLLKQFV